MRLLMTLVLVLLLAGCAAGRGDGAGSTTTQEETTTNGTEETTLTGQGGIPKPPDSTLSYGGREVKGTLGSYCWSSRNTFGCADSFGPWIASKRKTLTVPSGSEMVFRYGGQDPLKTVEAGVFSLDELEDKKGGVVRLDRSLKAHGSGVERTIPVELPPGEYVLEVSVKANEEDGADYYFRIMVG